MTPHGAPSFLRRGRSSRARRRLRDPEELQESAQGRSPSPAAAIAMPTAINSAARPNTQAHDRCRGDRQQQRERIVHIRPGQQDRAHGEDRGAGDQDGQPGAGVHGLMPGQADRGPRERAADTVVLGLDQDVRGGAASRDHLRHQAAGDPRRAPLHRGEPPRGDAHLRRPIRVWPSAAPDCRRSTCGPASAPAARSASRCRAPPA